MLTRPRPVDTRYFDSIFNCPVRYGAARNGLVYSVDDMLFTLPTANRQMSVLHDSLIDKNLSEKQGGKYSKLAQNKIIARLSANSLTLETVSADLNMSVSGLKRRLQAEHTSFQQLVDETRRQLAESHLLHQDTSLAEIAFLLGFSESSAFNRAFKRWTGVTPRQWRQQVRHIE